MKTGILSKIFDWFTLDAKQIHFINSFCTTTTHSNK